MTVLTQNDRLRWCERDVTSKESDMLFDYVHVEDYQEEPDDEEAHIEQG